MSDITSEERAVKYNIKRWLVPKTKNMDDCYKELALFAKTIERLALSIGNIGLSKIARQYKIAMKKIYDEYKRKIKNITDAATKGHYTITCRRNMVTLALNLAKEVRTQAENMIALYDMAYDFSNILNGQTSSHTTQKLDDIPEKNPAFDNIEKNLPKTQRLLNQQIQLPPPTYTPPPVQC